MARPRDGYHHGDLRAALIAAAETALAENGVDDFSLRQVAKRVGVSHSAPAHHFGDAQGLLCALAAEGFRRFRAAMLARQAAAPPDPMAQLVASGLGYLDFAESAPALYTLMFASERTRPGTPELAEAGEAAFHVLTDAIEGLRGVSPFEDEGAMADVIACWSMAHGFAELLLAGRMAQVGGLAKPEREALFGRMIERAVG
jgi:AcrR family transcriptional regulator